ncbi:uncharacterized protein LOC119590964, partial [Penaeus monodon]|uniref:uncharacterized protein LOC119590964 n=1 Tax=Penaeus monodon TaxID=6687 RepID=UPI0018A7270C
DLSSDRQEPGRRHHPGGVSRVGLSGRNHRAEPQHDGHGALHEAGARRRRGSSALTPFPQPPLSAFASHARTPSPPAGPRKEAEGKRRKPKEAEGTRRNRWRSCGRSLPEGLESGLLRPRPWEILRGPSTDSSSLRSLVLGRRSGRMVVERSCSNVEGNTYFFLQERRIVRKKKRQCVGGEASEGAGLERRLPMAG